MRIGALGRFTFAPGHYIYTGSAKRNMDARIRRHRVKQKPLRWHVDYLMAAPGVRITQVVRLDADECSLNQQVQGTVPVPGMGASDCRAGCGSHLKYIGQSAGINPLDGQAC